MALIISSGSVISTYSYTAYGEITSVSGSSLGVLNPMRYKGYFYDEESGYYYCKSRYYVPTIGRWLTPDKVKYLDNSVICGYNPFIYCKNNPIMYVDEDGNSAIACLLIGIGIGALAGGITSGVTSYVSGIRGNAFWGDVFGGMLIGGALGAAGTIGGLFGAGIIGSTATILGFSMSTVASFSAGVGSYALKETIGRGKQWNTEDAMLNGAITAGESIITFVLGTAFAASGIWKSLNQGEFGKYYSYLNGGLSRSKSFLGASFMYVDSNVAQIVLRTGLKTIFVYPWSLMRRLINE